ncbi:MFS transporter [Lactiplantibacillus paraplantarum]|uniref:MFS transporter n=1 Tax=Lactiplantibacillus paraplantarum TaxID=60520 RepID=UPI00051358AE|nr:MFS transporter [Lactiplantibacillus paraplantarum]OAX75860.1 MFS transporter [Lactiplantibacillus plantarum]ALO04325.1 MFS transporter [Lactiplantibacillus paraplantarum]KGE75804.1 MFS transporter [Lactiplantibacillus paraplantarum]MCW1909551.1 MFS transporter [Lactiplantibacillus paraplantarum]RDG13927.1 MFS transporter [Lactiplantibacillus paraplantarum]
MSPIFNQIISRNQHTERLLIIGLFCGVFVTGADAFIISALLPAIATSLNVAANTAAYGVTVYALCYAIGAPLFGPLGDRFNKRFLLISGCSVFLLGTLLCGLANSLTTFYLYRAIAGIGAALFVPNVWAFIGTYFDGQRLNQVMGIVMSALSLSIAVGVPLGALLAQLGSWHMAFWGSSVLTLFALLILTITVPPLPSQNIQPAGYFTSFKVLAHTPHAIAALLITLTWMTGFYGVYTFLGTFATATFHFNTAQTGVLFITYGSANFIASFLAGKFIALIGKKRSVTINGLASAALVLSLGIWGQHLAILLMLLVALALSQGWGVTALTAAIVNIVPSNRSTVMSFNSAFLYYGLTLGSAAGGLLLTKIGFSAVTIVAAVALLSAVLIANALNHYSD